MEQNLAPELNDILRNIERRNDCAIMEIEKNRLEFDKRANKIINFIRFREKIDKIEAGYHLIFSSDEIKEMKKLTQKTGDELYFKALKESKGNEKKAISLLFSPSSNI